MMSTIHTTLRTLALFVTLSLPFVPVAGQGIEFFHGTWEEALVEAKSQDKLLFVDAYAQWCGPCKRMAKNVFTKAEVGDYFNDNFINLKLDMEQPDGRSFGSKHTVSAYPTLFFLDPEGEQVHKSTGGKDVKGLIELGKKAMLNWDRSGDYAEKYNAGDRDYDLIVGYVTELNKVGKPSLKISNDYLKSMPSLTKEQMAGFLMAAVTESDSRLYTKLMEYKAPALALVGAEAFEKKVRTAVMKTVAKAVEFDFEDLVQEGIDNYKAAGVGDAKKFDLEAQMQYHLLSANYPEWKELSDKYLKKYGKKEPDLYKKQLADLQKTFTHESDFQEYACDVCKDMVKKKDTADNYSQYIQLLMGCKNYVEARKVTEEAIKKAQSRDEDIVQFEKILEYLDKL